MTILREEKKIKRPLLYGTGGLVLGETMALFLTVRRGIFWLAVLLPLFFSVYLHGRAGKPAWSGNAGKRGGGGLPAFFVRASYPALLLLLGVLLGFFVMEREEIEFCREEGFFAAGGAEVSGITGPGAVASGDPALGTAGTGTAASKVTVSGIVVSMEERETGMRLVLKNCQVWRAGKGTEVRRVFCYTEEDPGLRIGQRIRAVGEGEAAGPARNPGGFDYRLYCRGRGIGGILYASEVSLENSCFQPVSDGLSRLKRRLSRQLLSIAPPKDGGILTAVLLGEKEELDASVYELYRKNGISHLLAISGLHVSILGLGVWKSLRKSGIGYFLSGSLAWGFLVFYGKMVGFGPSVTRAVAMAGLSFLAAALGRTYDLLSALCVPAIVLLLMRPYSLTQAAFQLSFLAVGAVAVPGQTLLREWKRSGRRTSGLVSSLFVSASIQAVTAPVILYHSFELPPYGVFLNLLVIPLMAYVVVSGLLGLFASFLSPGLGTALLGGAHYILALYERLCTGVEALPFSSVILGRPSLGQMAAYYGCLAAGIFLTAGSWRERGESWLAGLFPANVRRGGRRFSLAADSRRERGPFPLAWCLAFWCAGALFLLPAPSRGLFVTFLDVDQGDGIVLMAGGRTMLVDCGSAGESKVGEKRLVPFLKSQGVRKLDVVFVSHGDRDHVNGIQYLLKEETGISIGRLILPKAGKDEIYGELAAMAGKRGIPVSLAEKGTILEEPLGEQISVSCLYPSAQSACKSRNEESLVLRIQYGRFSMLLTGDVEAEGEAELLEGGGLSPVTVLKAAHHGSASSTEEAFLEAVSPSWVILSYGKDNRYGHPAPETMERLSKTKARLFSTAESGAVRLWTDGERVLARGYVGE